MGKIFQTGEQVVDSDIYKWTITMHPWKMGDRQTDSHHRLADWHSKHT